MSSDVPSQDPSRFFCHCGKSFIRKEHLRRHESSHAKPAFVCQVCQKSFTRKYASLVNESLILTDFRTG